MIEQILFYKILIVTASFALFYIGEWLLPASPRKLHAIGTIKRQIKNAGLFIINIVASRFILIPLSVFVSEYRLLWRDDILLDAPFYVHFLISFLILDFFTYWWHRLNHEIPFLWRFHHVHHLDETLDTTSAVRFHLGEVILSAMARSVVIMVADIDVATILLYEALLLSIAIIQHSNVAIPQKIERILNYFIVTPAWHWMHHHSTVRDTNSHYGNFLTIWDRVFHTRASMERNPNMPIGIGGKTDLSIIKLLLAPFYKIR